MAKLLQFPGKDVIDKLKGYLDFFVWKGIPCVRNWPHYDPEAYPPKVSLMWANFSKINKLAGTCGAHLQSAYLTQSYDTPFTWKDMLLVCYYRAFPAGGAEKIFVSNLSMIQNPGNYQVNISSDIASFATIHLQPTKPTKLMRGKVHRGVNVMTFFNWAYNTQVSYPQTDPSDTTLHTFQLPLDPSTLYSWAHITFTISGTPSPSSSPPAYLPSIL